MTLLDEPVPFREALKQTVLKGLFPTDLNSGELSQVSAQLRRTSIFSARTALTDYLQEIKNSVESIIQPTTGMSKDRETQQNPSGFVTSGLDPASARVKLKGVLDSLGYQPEEGKAGTIEDLSSDKRVDLVVKTNVQLGHGAGRFLQENGDADVVDLWPALEFVRFEDRKEPRDWPHRWRIAAQVAGDVDAARILEETGRMVALKSSDIWQELGDGAGGYSDTLGNPYPPFAFQSGMWTEEVSRKEAEELGLLDDGEEAKPARFNLADLFGIDDE